MFSRFFRYFWWNPNTQLVAAKDVVERAVTENKLLIFSKTTCPYCMRAKRILSSEFPATEAKVYELDEREDGDAIRRYLKEKTGQRTVPNIFINHKYVGGCDTIVMLQRNGKLAGLMDAP